MKMIAKGKPDKNLDLLLEYDTPQTHINMVNTPVIEKKIAIKFPTKLGGGKRCIPQNAEASQPPTR